MRFPLCVSLALTFLLSLASAVSQIERQASIFAWPLSSQQPQQLASVSFTSTNASIKSYTAPSIPAGDDIVRVGFYQPSGQWSGIATSASNFAAEKPKTLQLHVRSDGELYHLGFKVAEPVSQGKGKSTSKKDAVTVEVVAIKQGPVPVLNKPVVINADGTGEEKEPEKSFLQKYWWALALFLLFQVMMGGGKE